MPWAPRVSIAASRWCAEMRRDARHTRSSILAALTAAACSVTLAALCAAPAHAYFDMLEPDARSLAMGRAASADVTGPAALFWNPARLAEPMPFTATAANGQPYALSNLTEVAVSVRVPMRAAPLAIGWHTTRLSQALSEDFLAVGSAVKRGRVSVGAAAEVARVGVASEVLDATPSLAGSATRVSASAGATYAMNRDMTLAAVLRHAAAPTFPLVPGATDIGGGLPREAEAAWAYHWNPASTVVAALTKDARGWRQQFGAEVVFSDVFHLRAGLSRYDLAGGIGLSRPRWDADVSFLTHPDLGNSYRFAFTYHAAAPAGGAR